MFNPNDYRIIADPDGKALAAAQRAQAQEAGAPYLAAFIGILHALEQLDNAHNEPLTIALETSCGQRITVTIATDKPCSEAVR
jgi:hypothetical protein